MTDLELELMIAEEALHEAEESFDWLREDYHALRKHVDLLENLLCSHGIDYPEFYG